MRVSNTIFFFFNLIQHSLDLQTVQGHYDRCKNEKHYLIRLCTMQFKDALIFIINNLQK